jgi:chorismate synthase
MLRFTTAGESHGPALVSILEGAPAGIPLLAQDIDDDLGRRQQGYGRGRRMQIEKDQVELLSGVRAGYTLGSPIAMTHAIFSNARLLARLPRALRLERSAESCSRRSA